MERRFNSSLLIAGMVAAAASVGSFSGAVREFQVTKNGADIGYTPSLRRNRGKGAIKASAKKRNKAWACGRGNDGRSK